MFCYESIGYTCKPLLEMEPNGPGEFDVDQAIVNVVAIFKGSASLFPKKSEDLT